MGNSSQPEATTQQTFAEALKKHAIDMGYNSAKLWALTANHNILRLYSQDHQVDLIVRSTWSKATVVELAAQSMRSSKWEDVVSILPTRENDAFFLRFLADNWQHAVTFVTLCKNSRDPKITSRNMLVVGRSGCTVCIRDQCDCKRRLAAMDTPRWLTWSAVGLMQDINRVIGCKMIELVWDLWM